MFILHRHVSLSLTLNSNDIEISDLFSTQGTADLEGFSLHSHLTETPMNTFRNILKKEAIL